MSGVKPYFKENSFVLYQGDYLKIIKQFLANYFDMIFADPFNLFIYL